MGVIIVRECDGCGFNTFHNKTKREWITIQKDGGYKFICSVCQKKLLGKVI